MLVILLRMNLPIKKWANTDNVLDFKFFKFNNRSKFTIILKLIAQTYYVAHE